MNDHIHIPGDASWLEKLFGQSPDGILILNLQNVVLAANRSFAAMCGLTEDRVVGRNIMDLLCPESRSNWEHDISKLSRGEWSVLTETCLSVEGRLVPVEIDLIADTKYRDQEALMLHVRNISIYSKVKNALVDAQNQWEMSFNAINDGMWILDRNGRVLRANQAAMRQIIPLKTDPIGLKLFSLLQMKTAEKSERDITVKLFDESCSFPILEFEQLAGKYSLTSYPIKSELGETTGCIVIIKDITEQDLQEQFLKKLDMQRQRTNRIEALGRMAGGIAHDFNNILTTLLGYISLVLQSESLGRTERSYLVEIMHTVERGTALTRQLFDFSAEKTAKFKTINLNNVIENMRQMLAQILGPKIRVVTRLDQQLWNINADVSRVERIITNFVSNARDAMPAGGEFTLETANTCLDADFCRHHPELNPGNYVLLQASDTGSGMTPDVAERIFEPFFTTKPKGKGIGLGLPSVFGIVRQFGGAIICYTEAGRGTTFKVYLPQSTSEIARERPAPTAKDLPGGTETVLIVDDEVHIVSMLSKILSKIGYKVITATNSSKAISICRESREKIDVVLSDIIMPDMNGVELISVLRESHPNLKVIFMSGYTNSMASESSGMSKDTIFLQKPFTFEDLARKLRDSLNQPPVKTGSTVEKYEHEIQTQNQGT